MPDRNGPTQDEEAGPFEVPIDVGADGLARDVVTHTSVGVTTVLPDGTVAFANPALERVLGYRPAELVGEQFAEVVSPPFEPAVGRALDRFVDADGAESDRVSFVAVRSDGSEVPLRAQLRRHSHDGQPLVTATLRERKPEAESEELDRFEELFAHVSNGVYRTTVDGTIREVNETVCRILGGPSRDSLRGRDVTELFVDQERAAEIRERLAEDGRVREEEVQLLTATGERVWVSLTAGTCTTDGEPYVRGVLEDITVRKERERELRERQQTIETVLSNIPGILFTLDDEGVFTRSEGRPLARLGLEPGEVIGESVFDLYADYPEIVSVCRRALEGETGSHTVEVQGRVFETTYEPIVEDGSVEQVVGFSYDVTERKRRTERLERQSNSLQRIKQITDSLRPINRAIARASTPEAVERAACDQLTASDAYLFAWYGEYNPENGTVTPKQWAGVETEYVDAVTSETVADSPLRARIQSALERQTVETLRNVLSDPALESQREDALARGYQSVAAIPVTFDETVYGVITVYSGRPDAFDEYERGLFRDLGERIGHAVHAAKSQRLLHTDTVVELEFTRRGSGLAAVTEELDCRLELATVVPAGEGTFLCYVTVDGVAPETLAERLSTLPDVDRPRVVDATGTSGRVEYRVTGGPVTTLHAYGAAVTAQEVAAGEERIVARASPEADIHQLITGMEDAHEDTTFVSKRSVTGAVDRAPLSDATFEAVLTDRQREVLALAYHGGFFESPRSSTGDELADALGIASSTFYLHVRKATQKIFEQFDQSGLLE